MQCREAQGHLPSSHGAIRSSRHPMLRQVLLGRIPDGRRLGCFFLLRPWLKIRRQRFLKKTYHAHVPQQKHDQLTESSMCRCVGPFQHPTSAAASSADRHQPVHHCLQIHALGLRTAPHLQKRTKKHHKAWRCLTPHHGLCRFVSSPRGF